MDAKQFLGGLAAPALLVVMLFGVLPLWLYLVHWVLRASGAGELQMFLYWAYVVLSIVLALLQDIVRRLAKD